MGHGTEDAASGPTPVAPASLAAAPAGWVDAGEPAQVAAATAPLPAELARYAGRESHLILRALWQHFLDSAAGRPDDAAAPDPVFFETMALIYLASHDPTLPAAARAGLPRASWFLLEHYLKLHPALRAALNQELDRPARMVWNASTIRFRLQTIAGLFLAYHGFRPDGPLLACADSAAWDEQTTRQFYVAHGEEVGLKRPPYW